MISERLLATLTSVNDWLKFAETKLTVLITVNGAAAFACAQLLTNEKFPEYVKIALLSYLLLTIVSIMVALLSVTPRVRIVPRQPSVRPQDTDNILFYGHAAHYDPQTYLERFSFLVGQAPGDTTPYDWALAQQIISNADICLAKYTAFTWAMRATLYAIITCMVILALGALTPLY